MTQIDPGFYDINVYVGLTGQCPVGNNYIPLDTIATALQVDFTNSTIDLQNTNFNIFPNPSTGKFTVEIGNGRSYNVQVINNLGQIVMTALLENKINPISLNNVAAGIYFLEFEDVKSKDRFTKKIEVK